MDWLTRKLVAGHLARPDGAGCVVADAVELAAVAAGRLAADAGRRRAVGVEAARGDGAAWRSRSCSGSLRRRRSLCAVLMITSRNPVYAALWFARGDAQRVRTVPAAVGAVSRGGDDHRLRRRDHRDVPVRDHARPAGGATAYDQRPRQPLLATIVAFVLLGRAGLHAQDLGRAPGDRVGGRGPGGDHRRTR